MPFAFLMKDRIVAPPGFNRWRIPPVSIAIHLCIGSVYSWSIFNPALTKEVGVVAGAADDWEHQFGSLGFSPLPSSFWGWPPPWAADGWKASARAASV